ncbi:hypothetical protein GCM10010415_00650 [Streptomyces atrovirens]
MRQVVRAHNGEIGETVTGADINDPLNLIPVDGGANSAKSDSGPATWLPPDKRIRCAYAVRFAQVAVEYEMPVTPADKRMMLEQCGG